MIPAILLSRFILPPSLDRMPFIFSQRHSKVVQACGENVTSLHLDITFSPS
uniref:Uncharacterized protein n=1 Tax=Anguilla anguilla TaxID=7936 RepID=A0A0E9U4J3_ANGAN